MLLGAEIRRGPRHAGAAHVGRRLAVHPAGGYGGARARAMALGAGTPASGSRVVEATSLDPLEEDLRLVASFCRSGPEQGGGLREDVLGGMKGCGFFSWGSGDGGDL